MLLIRRWRTPTEVEDDIAGRIDHDQADVLCGISLAGVVAESIKFGDGIGGFADLSQLQVRIRYRTGMISHTCSHTHAARARSIRILPCDKCEGTCVQCCAGSYTGK